MFWRFILRRIANGVLIYAILTFAFSAIFNTVNEKTARAEIEEYLRMDIQRLKNVKAEDLKKYVDERRAYWHRLYRLDQPLVRRILWRTGNTLLFKYGRSTIVKSATGDRQVLRIIAEVLPRTVLLFTTATLFEVLFGVFFGLKMARKAGGALDRAASIGTMVVYGMPSWWLGMIMIMIFAYGIGIFPSGGMYSTPPPAGFLRLLDLLFHMSLPLLTLVVIAFWGVSYLTRNIVLGVLQEDYIMAARARGLPERKVLYGHTMRTAAPPILTLAVLSLVFSFSGNIVFEGVFNWPGMGNLYWIAVQQNDVPVLMGLLSVTTGLVIVSLIMLDVVYGLLDPRVKVGRRA
jgi:peptide/nickel transport system permease protein